MNWRDVHYVTDNEGVYVLHGTMTLQDAGTARVKIYDITNGASQAVEAEYDAALPVGVHRTMDDAGRRFRDTPFDDWVDGGAGHDRILLRGGEDIAHAGAGNDVIRAIGVGRSLLDGGEGDDRITLTSAAPYGMVHGGPGNDRIQRGRARRHALRRRRQRLAIRSRGDTAGGTVITDAEGRNRLRIDNGDTPLGFERVPNSDNLYILLGGGETYDRSRDVVWVDFFASPDNRVNGLTTAMVADRATTFRPVPEAPIEPTTAEFVNAAYWAYGRDEGDYPADLRPFEVDGRHLALEITEDGFYGAAFLTPDDQVIVAFEGTNLSALEDDPVFVAAQVAADIQIYFGLVPDAYGHALDFTDTVIEAAAAQGIGAAEVFVAGHSLGAAQAQYVAAQLGLAGQTYGGPGLADEAIPAAATSRLVNYVEYGDPIGNYSADPNYLGGFLFSDEVLRFGDATYVGDPLARLALEAAGGPARNGRDAGGERRGPRRARRPRQGVPPADQLRRGPRRGARRPRRRGRRGGAAASRTSCDRPAPRLTTAARVSRSANGLCARAGRAALCTGRWPISRRQRTRGPLAD